MAKHEPFKGEHLYLRTYSNLYYCNMVKNPYTVVEVNKNKTICYVQEATPVFRGVRYYDTLADDIVENPNGAIKKLRWSEKNQRWQESPAGSYPECAVFGTWEYYPYLD